MTTQEKSFVDLLKEKKKTEDDLIMEMFNAGNTTQKIARQLKLSLSYVIYFINDKLLP